VRGDDRSRLILLAERLPSLRDLLGFFLRVLFLIFVSYERCLYVFVY
jgi:hypothetical protein